MFVPSRGTMATTDYGVSPTFLLLLSQSGVCQFTFLTGVYQFTFLTGVYHLAFLTGVYQLNFLTGVCQFSFLTGVYQFIFLSGSALTCSTHTVCHQYRDTLNTEYSFGIIFIIITTAS